MNRSLNALALSCAVLLASCGNDASSTTSSPPPTPTPAPTVVSVSPENGATGVAADARITVTFSQPMDQVATQAAYQSSSLPASGVTFDWNSAGTVLTITPNAPLVTVKGTSFSAAPQGYDFKLTGVAKDRAGTALTAWSAGFKTLRQITLSIYAESGLGGMVSNHGIVYKFEFIDVGDNDDNINFRGFLSFDLSKIPQEAGTGLEKADLYLYKNGVQGNPYVTLNPCKPTGITVCIQKEVPISLDHVAYGETLSGSAFNLPALPFSSTIDGILQKSGSYVSASVLNAVQDDLINADALKHHSQYRLSFPVPTNGDSKNDYVDFLTGTGARPHLDLTYKGP